MQTAPTIWIFAVILHEVKIVLAERLICHDAVNATFMSK